MAISNQTTSPPAIRAALTEKQSQPEAVLEHIDEGDDLIVGMFNSEPLTVLDALEANAERLSGVRIHQMLPYRERRYIHGVFPGLRHVSWFLSPANREAFHKNTCDLVPNNFSEAPSLMRRTTKCSLVLAAVSPPDRHGYFSLGTHADYVAALVGEAPFFVEVNHRMPRTYGENQVHISQVVGWCEADYPLSEIPSRPVREVDSKIAGYVAERVPDGATLQAGIGSIPNEVLGLLSDHKELGVNSELLADGFVDLIERGVITGTRKRTHRNKAIVANALGSRRLYEFVKENPGVEFWQSTTPTTSAAWRARRASLRSTPPSRSTFWASVPPSRWAASTGHHQEASRISRAGRSSPSTDS